MISLTHPDIRASLKTRLFELRASYRVLLSVATTASYAEVTIQARTYADNLAGLAGREIGRATAYGLQSTLISPWETRDLSFWLSPLGQAIAWWDGASYHSPLMGAVNRRMVVQAAGITRQASYKAMAKMDRDPLGNPTAAAVAAYLQRTYPHEITQLLERAPDA